MAINLVSGAARHEAQVIRRGPAWPPPWRRAARLLFAGTVIATAAAGCAAGAGRAVARESAAHPAYSARMRYLALGDSYTIGEGIPAAARWPERLAALLRERGVALDDPVVIARTGWTTDDLATALAGVDPRGPFDLVTLLVGVNDQYQGGTPAAYRPRFEALLARAIALAGGEPGRVVVLSIPDWGVSPFAATRDRSAIAAAIDAFNAENRAAAKAAGVAWVDVTAATRSAAVAGPATFAADGLHPGPAQHESWARLALPAAQAALATR